MAKMLERTSRWERRAVALLGVGVAIVVVSAALAAAALAGTYQVYSCRTPSGQSAPTEGWGATATGLAAVTEDTCEQPGGALVAALRAKTARVANTTAATWIFGTPTGETIAAATLWRAGDTYGVPSLFASYVFWLAGPTEFEPFDGCSDLSRCPSNAGDADQPFASANRVVVPSANLGQHLFASAFCGGKSGEECPENLGDPNGYAAVIYLYAADLTLEQSTLPSASGVSGELASAPTASGTSDIVFSASDPGSGVYEAVFDVDGRVVQRTVLDEDGGRCRSVGETDGGPAAFLYVQPCPATVNADVGFDTAKVSDGAHHLVVSVIDAAGNAATVLDRDITIDNPVPGGGGAPSAGGGPNGTNASAHATLAVGWKGARSARLTSAFGRAHTIVGRLTGTGGAPIGSAQIDVLATPAYAGAKTATTTGVHTGSDGRFTLELPEGVSSRALRFEYSDRLGGAPVVTRTLTLSVRAGVSLSVAPHTASVGRSIHFSGRLLGGPLPGGGKLLVLEARSPGGSWLEFDVVRSDARGRYHASYRFKFAGPASYQFRAVCEAEADYPFATGASRVVGVFER
jgi:hypothetical protein